MCTYDAKNVSRCMCKDREIWESRGRKFFVDEG
jgi:hypothetical protein